MACVEVTDSATTIIYTISVVSAVFRNEGDVAVYLDVTSSVTADQSSTGRYRLAPGESITLPGVPGDDSYFAVYGITPAGTSNVSYIAV